MTIIIIMYTVYNHLQKGGYRDGGDKQGYCAVPICNLTSNVPNLPCTPT